MIVELYPQHMGALEVALHTGMRKGEQFSLTWKQLDFDRGYIQLDNTKNKSRRIVL